MVLPGLKPRTCTAVAISSSVHHGAQRRGGTKAMEPGHGRGGGGRGHVTPAWPGALELGMHKAQSANKTGSLDKG